MIELLRKVIQKQELFSKKDLLLVGVSGGMDSMVLCHVLLKEGYTLIMAHCNYHLRGTESDLDEKLVRDWSSENNISSVFKSCTLLNTKNIQEEARKLRYDFFNEVKESANCKYILTAHHGNDQIETFFLNLSRGAGIRGLKGIQNQSGDILRPFLGVSKKEIYEYAIRNNVPYREDLSNSAIHYLRNFFRNEVILIINNRIPAFYEMCIRSIHHLAEANAFIEVMYREWRISNVKEKDDEIEIIKPGIEKFYLLSQLLVDLGFHSETIQKIKMNYSKSGKLFTDKNEHELLINRNTIFIRKVNTDQNIELFTLNDNQGVLKLKNENYIWDLETKKETSFKLPFKMEEALIDSDLIKWPLILKKWAPGDTIQPLGMNGKTKKIQDVLTNCKISNFEKESIYILFSGNDALWIPGIMRSEVAKMSEQTKSFIRISRIDENEKV